MNGGADPHQTGLVGGFDAAAPAARAAPAATSISQSHGKSKSLQVIVSSHDNDDDLDADDNDTVGSLLADIANAVNDALGMLMFADKRHWSSDEFEQVRALDDALDEAKRDFQELGPLLKGSFYYENDRRLESLDELRLLRTQFAIHAQTFKDWLRQGGPINPLWARDTLDLRSQLQRAQRRAAARIFASQQADITGTHRCLGAFEVYRRQRRLEDRRKKYERRTSKYESTRDELAQAEQGEGGAGRRIGARGRIPSWKQQTPTMGALDPGFEAVEMGSMGTADGQTEAQQQQQHYSHQSDAVEQEAKLALSLEELVPACNAVGRFERLGDRDIAFSCDFCDGFIVWEDLMKMPAERDPLSVSSGVTEQPNWQACGKSVSTSEDKIVVFAPLAIANHLGPDLGDWQARILCPHCDEYNYYEAGDEDETKYAQDERGFGSLKEFQQHLEWHHTSVAVPSLPDAAKNCVVM